ncbi:hypothetical protein [Luteipulveratus mongoliensis]|uniref:Uncharacterized protein n=1 Tax=Luteipulveratus mongoliensis TaxID=571913 RepID=A0A0K1JEW0_9MICO|nr:hypothetical protein [Luteipulveratus mongoliensis]AKU15140.1 hypothetical protein VV02_03445 [Luteipulveratus mongoliensis]
MSTLKKVAGWSPADLLTLGVPGSDEPANEQRHALATSILAEYRPHATWLEEPPMLALLIAHRGDIRAAADDPHVIDHVRHSVARDAILTVTWRHLEQLVQNPGAHRPAPDYGPIGAVLATEANTVRARAGLDPITTGQLAARRIRVLLEHAGTGHLTKTDHPTREGE